MRQTADRSLQHLTTFFVLACLFSWLDWGLVVASNQGWIPFHVGLNPWGSFGPALAAIVMTAVTAGRGGIRDLFRPLLRWRFGLHWWAIIVLGPALLVALATGMYAATGGRVLPVAPPNYLELALLSVLLLVLGGPVGEEIGWRGYALPRLLERMRPVPASFVIAAMWGVWHLPLFWMPGSAQAGSSILVFVGLVAAFSLLTTWVYLGTGRSLLAAIVFHHFINLPTYFLPTLFPALDSTIGVDRILLVVAWLAAAAAVVDMSRRPAQRPS